MSEAAGRKLSTKLFNDGTYDIEEWHQVFLMADDVTEYKAAILLLDDWLEWVRLKKGSVMFRQKVRLWIEELELKQRSESIAKIRTLSKLETPAAYQAAKWIAERRYVEVNDRGRPSNKDLAKEAKDLAREAAETEEESKRIEKALLHKTTKE